MFLLNKAFHKKEAQGGVPPKNRGPFSFAHPMDPSSPESGAVKFWPLDSQGSTILDMNGDGYGDIALADKMKGVVYLAYGGADLTSSFDLNTLNGTNGIYIWPNNTVYSSDYSMVSGDINGDGFADLVLGIVSENLPPPHDKFGKVFVVYGGANLEENIFLDQLTEKSGLVIAGRPGDGSFGGKVTTGKFNRGYYDDILISDGIVDPQTNTSYAGYIFFGNHNLSSHYTIANLLSGEGCVVTDIVNTTYGVTVGVGRITGNLIDDLVIRPLAGRVYLVYGTNTFPFDIDLAKIGGQIDGTIFISKDKEGLSDLGYSIAIGDVNDDGLEDMMVTTYDGPAVYVVYGNRYFPPSFGTEIANGKRGMMLVSDSPYSSIFGEVAAIGDWNGDGIGDMAVQDDSRTIIVYGSRRLPRSVSLSSIDGYNGVAINTYGYFNAAFGDVNEDGFAELVVSNYLVYGRECLSLPEPSPTGLEGWKIVLITGVCVGVLGIGGTGAAMWLCMRKKRQYTTIN